MFRRRGQILGALWGVLGATATFALADPPSSVRATVAIQQLLQVPPGDEQQLYFYRLISYAKPHEERADADDDILEIGSPKAPLPKQPAAPPGPPPQPPKLRFRHERVKGTLPNKFKYYEKWRITDSKVVAAWRRLLTSPKLFEQQRCTQTASGFRCSGEPECFMPGAALEFRSSSRTVMVMICESCGFFLVTTPGSYMLLLATDEDDLVCPLRERSEDLSCYD